MKNIIDITQELIKKNKSAATEEIIQMIDNPSLMILPKHELAAIVANDLQTDGRFIFVNEAWDLKTNYTMNEVIKEQYKNIGHIVEMIEKEDEENVIIDDEIELIVETENSDDEIVEPGIDLDLIDTVSAEDDDD